MLNKIMNHTIKWSDTLKYLKYNDTYFDWTVDFNGKKLNVQPWIIKSDSGKFYKLSNPEINGFGITSAQV